MNNTSDFYTNPTIDSTDSEHKEPTFQVGTLIGALILLAVGAICISIAFGATINLMTVLIGTLVAGAVALLISAFRP